MLNFTLHPPYQSTLMILSSQLLWHLFGYTSRGRLAADRCELFGGVKGIQLPKQSTLKGTETYHSTTPTAAIIVAGPYVPCALDATPYVTTPATDHIVILQHYGVLNVNYPLERSWIQTPRRLLCHLRSEARSTL